MPFGKRASRVRRRIECYRLRGIGDDLASRWTTTHADDEPEVALEALTTYFNTAIVRSVLARAGADPRDYQPEDVYRLLSDDAAPVADETAVRTWLEDSHVDATTLIDAFVGRRAMHRYLEDVRGLEIPVPLEHPPEVAKRQDVTAAELEAHIDRAATPREADRLRFIRHLYEDTPVPEAAETVGYTPSTGYRWLRAWEEGGLDGLLTDGESGWRKLTPAQERRFVSHLATKDRWPIEDIEAFLAREFDVTYDDRHLRKKLGWYGIEKIHFVDAFQWSADAPDDPDARLSAALDEGEGEASSALTDEGRTALE